MNPQERLAEILEQQRRKRTANTRAVVLALLAIPVIFVVVVLLVSGPLQRDSVAKTMCYLIRNRKADTETVSQDCDRWLSLVKQSHESVLRQCLEDNGTTLKNAASIEYCFTENHIDPNAILGD